MTITPQAVSQLIRSRRAIFPEVYTGGDIPKVLIEEILENANWAPTHRKTEPWRFKIFRGEALPELGEFLASTYKKIIPVEKFSEKKYDRTRQKALRSSCVIAICMQRDPEERLPEWEEIAAVACAVQNMWLSCTAHGIGCYWSSPQMIHHTHEFLNLQEGERCLGFFYMGTHQLPELPASRGPVAEKLVWR